MMAILATWRPLFARGDRRLSKVLVKAWEAGCKFDGWTEFFNYETWLKAFADCGLDPHILHVVLVISTSHYLGIIWIAL